MQGHEQFGATRGVAGAVTRNVENEIDRHR